MIDPKPTTILIADDHDIIRMGLKFTLKEAFNAIIYEAANGDEVFEVIKKHPIDVVLLDLNMPDTNAQSILQTMLITRPDMNVIIFSVNKEEIYGKLYLQSGARGYLQKDAPSTEIIKAIKAVLSGNVYMRKEMQAFYLGNSIGIKEHTPYAALSKKEIEILHYLSAGDSLTKISKNTNLSPSTIGTHKANILAKLHLDNIIELREFTNIHPLS